MGQDSSKPAEDGVKHLFSSDAPVRLSPELSGRLQDSTESDSTRAKNLELLIQQRVHEELTRLNAEQDRRIEALEDQISAAPDPPSGADAKTKDLGREHVLRQLDHLRQKLTTHKMREAVIKDAEVSKAKDDVVHCLRINDRRPLDCWQEVEAFKREVGRLERAFLDRVLE